MGEAVDSLVRYFANVHSELVCSTTTERKQVDVCPFTTRNCVIRSDLDLEGNEELNKQQYHLGRIAYSLR